MTEGVVKYSVGWAFCMLHAAACRSVVLHCLRSAGKHRSLSVFRRVGGQALFPLAKFVGVCPGSDHAKSMLRVVAYLLGQMPGSFFYLPSTCKQHSTGLVLAPLTVFQQFLCPLFCSVKLLHQGSFYKTYLEGMFLTVRASVVRFDPVLDDVRPDPEDERKNASILEFCFYNRDLHILNSTADEAARHELEKGKRLRDGKRLLRVCQGDWSSNHIYHFSDGQCCRTESEAARCVFEAMMGVIGQSVPVPALNKWTQVHPVVSQFCLGFCCHNVMPRAIQYAHTLSVPECAEDVLEDGPPDEDGIAVGMARDERKAQAKEKAARSKKSLEWALSPNTLPSLLVWLCITLSVMRLHYFLFRDASRLHYDIPGRKHPIFDFTNVHKSRVTHVLATLTSLLVPSSDGHMSGWRVMYDRYGTSWASGSLNAARNCLLLAYGSLWRRMVWLFQRPPWRFAKIFNDSLPMEEGLGSSG